MGETFSPAGLMLTALASWFATQGAGLVLGALAKLALDGWSSA